jgi:hypothetical protein
MLPQRFHTDRRQRNRSLRVLCLGPDELEAARDSLESPDHFEFFAVEVSVLSTEPEQLAAA